MPDMERVVAGLRCREVLADLSEFLDGELPRARADQIEEHLRGCDWCARFGGEMAAVVTALRETLAEPDPVDPDVGSRLRDRLRDEFGDRSPS